MNAALPRHRELNDEVTPAHRYLLQVSAIAEAEVRKLRHDPMELLTRVVQPVLWLTIFGEVFAQVRGIPIGTMSYREFLAPGILAQSALFVAIFYGISAIWERDLGILYRYLASPAARSAIVIGKSVAAGIRALTQAAAVYVVALLLGSHLRHDLPAIAGVLGLVLLGAGIFATLSLIVACLVKTRERFMGIGQVLTMPLFFASNAIYPLSLMPSWLRVLASINPLTYQVDALRTLMISGYQSTFGLGTDVAVQCGCYLVLLAIAARLYPKILL
jgi:ABC-2 type transport system permease protein